MDKTDDLEQAPNPPTRAGYVALVGRPNVGKSTLLNAFLGEKLSIVTPLAQTTRERVTGILTRDETQIVFVDTPGLLEPRYLLQQSMLDAALAALEGADAVVLMLDATRPDELPPAETLDTLVQRDDLIVVINKVDAAAAEAIDSLRNWSEGNAPGASVLEVSAEKGTGLGDLLDRLDARLPPSPFYFPDDEVAIQPVRFFVAEFVRETLFETLREEVPYSTAVQIEEFREEEDPLYIRATIYVERESQKAIVIGKGGREIREIGAASRSKIESFLQRRVYLDLWVKARAGWRRKREGLRTMGYELPREG